MAHDTDEAPSPEFSGPRARPWRDVVASATIMLLAIASQRWVLDLPLTAIDTIPTLAAARADGLMELMNVLARELRGGVAETYYYRPLTLVSYTFDQWIWGGTAWGYHLTDVVLHGAAAVAVYWLARSAVDLGRWLALLAAAVFIIHPATIEVVPAIARRQEPLMVIGFCLALIGARAVPRRPGWLLMMLGTLVAVTASERGLAIPGVVAGYLFFYRFAGSSLRDRLVSSVRWVLPAVAMCAGFFILRSLLYGSAGAAFRPDNFVNMPIQFALWLLYPQQMIDISAPTSTAGLIAFLSTAALLGLAFLVPVLRSSRRRLLWVALTWVGGYTLFISIAGHLNPWYVYTAVPGFALTVAFFTREASLLFTGHSPAKLRAGLSAVAALVLVLCVGVPSPVSRDYPAWSIAAGLSDRFLSELARLTNELPATDSIAIINLPAHYCESNSDYMVTRSAAILWPSSIAAWRQENEVKCQVQLIGSADFVAGTSVPEIRMTDDAVQVYFAEGNSTYTNSNGEWPGATRLPDEIGRGYEFPLTPGSDGEAHPTIFVFDGQRLVPYAGRS